MGNLEVILNPWCVRATIPANVPCDDKESNLVPQGRFLEYEGSVLFYESGSQFHQ